MTEVLTNERHFEQAGFRALFPDSSLLSPILCPQISGAPSCYRLDAECDQAPVRGTQQLQELLEIPWYPGRRQRRFAV